MITRIEALGFRCLRYIQQPLDSFHVLVGPNASGKTTFLDIVPFLGALVRGGPEAAVRERTGNFQDLVWRREGIAFELAVEVAVPERLIRPEHDTLRYEVKVGLDPTTGEIGLDAERLYFVARRESLLPEKQLFPRIAAVPSTILLPAAPRVVVEKSDGEHDWFLSEASGKYAHDVPIYYRLGRRRSALGNLPEDETMWPVATWFKRFLADSIQQVVLHSQHLRQASPPGQARHFKPDGSNLPWVVADLEKRSPERFAQWIEHLQTVLPDLEGIRTQVREDDRHRYVVLRYRGGLDVPSWVASDGTMRLLALTLPAYLPDLEGIYLIEEPENGIHPRAIEAVTQSLSSVYDAQVLLATHSPILVGVLDPAQILCFAKTAEGATDIVSGSEHPKLQEWKGDTNLSVLFAAGVLG